MCVMQISKDAAGVVFEPEDAGQWATRLVLEVLNKVDPTRVMIKALNRVLTVVCHKKNVAMGYVGNDRMKKETPNTLVLSIGVNGDVGKLKWVLRPFSQSVLDKRSENATCPRLMRGGIVATGKSGNLAMLIPDDSDKPR